ncbi:efflux RND transporter periplasmic adaptor subunit [Aurantimonas sp. VKM B-3413]|uniref:efflux RND transporter periplasmic adaptor subunit n=1 Tax=Aurantimonas sp. VKM B-3413 TaxID=2779401 RepID=UPI001E54C7E3|nr:efflux RND transporter periplasmic adaptor subunit [Aurantimonas sp. VKM B-3413]MCB8839117.1 efflux RND transporter periplasmic adaptor subunit [Aurantimonas sp. VKM B-3413]
MVRPLHFVPLLAALAFLSACSGSGNDEAGAPEPPRPVLTSVVAPTDPQVLGYSGTIAPRYESALGFRSLGRIVSREVDVGDRVEADQQLAAIDAETLGADVRSAKAQLANAEIQDRTAKASLQRAQALFNDNKTVSQSDLDSARQSASAASAELVSAKAQLAKAENALSYAVLTAPFAGVITERDANVGQVVAAGETVMKLARTDQLEAVVDIPAAEVSGLSAGSPFEIVLQIAPALKVAGKVREIAPQADALTRTNRVRILLDDPSEAFRIGALITAIPAERAKQPVVLVPQSALLEENGKTFVWTVDPETKTVHRQLVEIHRDAGGRIILESGVETGSILVTAGVHSLKEGQAVSLPEGLSS